MKLNLSRKGFTLVEIMIVVVIIGLLAALAIPAFKKVRNTSVEKTLFNDARQISSAFNQYTTENSTTECTLSNLIGPNSYVSSLSNGTLIDRAQESNFTNGDKLWSNKVSMDLELTSSAQDQLKSMIALGNLGYNTALTSNTQITTGSQGNYSKEGTGNNFLNFSVETGALLKKGATNPNQTAAYQN